MNGSNHCRPKQLLLPHHELFEEVYGNVVERRKQDAAVARKEVIYLTLVVVLRSEFFGGDKSGLVPIITNLVHILVVLLHGKCGFNYYWLIYNILMINQIY